MYCSSCGDERVFEQPPCPDGHGADCPELACVDCGSAVLTGMPVMQIPDDARPEFVPAPRTAPSASPTRAA